MPESPSKRIAIACGGTGGHLFPGIAVAEEWISRGGEAILLISEKQIDSLAAAGHPGLRFERVPAAAMPGLLSPRLPGFALSVLRSLAACRRLLRDFGADAVLGMGGFTSTAPLAAGRLAGVPGYIHESNAVPGRANRLNARMARAVLVGFPGCAEHFGPGRRVEVVGTPLRPSLVAKPARAAAAARFGLRQGRETLLVMGGSQGARRLNELVASGLDEFSSSGVQVLHIAGPADYEAVAPAYRERPGAGAVLEFCSDIENAYAAADLALCRAGASTLTELAYYETPAVLIPYPYAADDHQTANAGIFSEPGAAEMWRQEEISDTEFAKDILRIIKDAARLRRMREAMGRLAVPDASARACDIILADLAGHGG